MLLNEVKNLGNNTLDVPEILRYVLDDFSFFMKMYPPIVKSKIFRTKICKK